MKNSIYFIGAFAAAILFPAEFTFAATVSGPITSDTTWTNQVYEVVGNVTVNSGVTLTIDPGAIVKFYSNKGLVVNGVLDVQGTASSSVYFTSVADDSVGGDTNANGPSSGSAGDWKGINVLSGGSAIVNHAIIIYGGGDTPFANISNYSGALSVSSSDISNSAAYGIHNGGYGTTSIGTTNFHDNSSYNLYAVNVSALSIATSTFTGGNAAYINNVTTFTHSNNYASSTSGYLAGFIIAGGISSDQTWTGDAMPYIVDGTFTVSLGSTLTVNPGALVKFKSNGGLSISGVLSAEGSLGSSIYFTSIADDSIGGDTNANGSSSGSAGDWKGINVLSGGIAYINRAIIRYGGSNSPYANVSNVDGTLEMVNSESSSAIYGISSQYGTTTVTRTEISNNAYGYYLLGGPSIFSSNIIHNNSAYGMLYGSGGTALAEGNYWGGNLGPYNATNNPTGNGDTVSTNVDFTPFATTSVMQSYTEPTITSVSNNGGTNLLLWDFLDNATTTYLSEWQGAVSTWSTLGLVEIATSTNSASTTLFIADVSNPYASWKGSYTPPYSNSFGLIEFNIDRMATASADIQNTCTHELGHALGLLHSYSDNIMYPLNSSQVTLGIQDLSDYYFLWN